MTQEFSDIQIYEHYLNVVRKIINIKLTVLHTLMLFYRTQTPDHLQCSSRTRAHYEANFGQLKGRFQGPKSLRVAPDSDIACAIFHNTTNIRKRKI